jgi:RNA polymerase sigma-70 factor (ECF subfamily)
VTPAPDAFRQQLLGALPRLRRYARTLAFDASQADDLVQSTVERALSHWHQFDPHRDIVVWLLSIAHNAFADARRRDARWVWQDVDEVQSLPEAAHNGPDVGLRLDLLAALKRLRPEQVEPLLLVSVEQLSYAECAQVLGIPVGTVMSRVCRARAQLRSLLDGHGTPNLKRVV